MATVGNQLDFSCFVLSSTEYVRYKASFLLHRFVVSSLIVKHRPMVDTSDNFMSIVRHCPE